MSDQTYDLGQLESSARKWAASPSLRTVYADIYRSMRRAAKPGPALEIGSGCGFIKEFVEKVITSDIRKTRFVDTAASAYAIESVPGGPWTTLYLLDVLHHLREPFRFFQSAAGALSPGGRIVIVEPASTPLGRIFYSLFHHEPMRTAQIAPPYAFTTDTGGEFANMAMAWCLFIRDHQKTSERLSSFGLRTVRVLFRDLLAYPATGGFSKGTLLPAFACRTLLSLEHSLPQPLFRFLGLRMLMVIERASTNAA